MRTNQKGEEDVYQTVKLTEASIEQVSRFTGDEDDIQSTESEQSPGTAPSEFERWSFTFRKIEVTDKDGNTTFVYDGVAPG